MKKHSLAGGIWLCIIGGFAFTYAFLLFISLIGNSYGKSEAVTMWGWMVFAAITAFVCLPIGIVLLVVKSRQNRQIDAYYREHPEIQANEPMFIAYCPNCGNQMMYKTIDIRRHRRWATGYILCYRCRRPMGVDPSRDEPVPQQGVIRSQTVYGQQISNGWNQPVYGQQPIYNQPTQYVNQQANALSQPYVQSQNTVVPQPDSSVSKWGQPESEIGKTEMN
ncbi:MAG: hypothetical protein IK088_05545 [Lachnospiraceae bacterium]|nr:hypothetical protein [Lachnospiraceae bacterium]